MRPSLTRRLLTLYSMTVLVVVGVAGGLVWCMMRRALHAELDNTLQTEAIALASRLENNHGRVEFEHGVAGLESSSPPPILKRDDRSVGSTAPPRPAASRPDVRIWDEQGHMVFSSSAVPADDFEPLSVATPSTSPVWLTARLAPNEGLSRALALYVMVPPEEDGAVDGAEPVAVGAWVLVARSLASIDRTLAQLSSILASAAGAAMLLALAGGLVVARRGTRPVRAVAESVGQVDPADPELKLDRGQVPTELLPIVRTTERLLERVRGELARQRQLTADVAHDLRTPVAGVRTLLDVCLQRERSATEYTAAMQKAQAALRQLSHLLDDVLTLSRLDAYVDRPRCAAVSLEEVLNAASTMVQPLAAARQVAIQTESCPRIVLNTDRAKLAKILSNLLGNAIEHSPAGAVVQMAARLVDGTLELSIADRGTGVPVEMRSCIFDRFIRADAARTSGDGHHGLGLPIAAGLARLLNGEITLDERHEPGSRFVVRLPVQGS